MSSDTVPQKEIVIHGSSPVALLCGAAGYSYAEILKI